MLTINDILTSVTKIISDNFTEDIFVDSENQSFDTNCFFISVAFSKSIPSNKKINRKQLTVSIQYFQDENGELFELHEVMDKLDNIFTRTLKVKDDNEYRYLTIQNKSPNIMHDDVGTFLDYLMDFEYLDGIKEEEEEYDNMGTVDIEAKY